MKLKIFFCCIACFSLKDLLHAQQQPYYTQYILNNFILNPALAGSENYWDIKASYRNQWVGLNGAPVTAYLTIQGPLKKTDYQRETATTVHSSDENAGGKQFWMEYTAPPAHQGIGLTIINDRTGPLNNFIAYGTYAYHVPVGVKTSLSAGVSFGVQDRSVDASKVDFGTINPSDPAIAGSGYLNKFKLDFNAGLWLSSANYFLGLSALQIIPQSLDYSNTEITGDSIRMIKGKLVPHLFLSTGVKFRIDDNVSFLPSIVVKYVQPLPLSVDINAKLQYQDLIWVGASYRYKEGFAGLVGINISSTLNLGYSYDYTTTELNTVSKGTHEIVIGFILGRKGGDNSPRKLL